ncbi:hypothetical protein LOK49_LG03G03014 [Camellia lanceoleosa]|uniref:Uncharacterized protein n=1 Tax=Camellia lanceoleosa TaxID=1840588 RepID=A0ACC0IGN4_9ERIC|nr:hypothetical protein LOK49_LG03G03014 [Camellia lanceoleosa]
MANSPSLKQKRENSKVDLFPVPPLEGVAEREEKKRNIKQSFQPVNPHSFI